MFINLGISLNSKQINDIIYGNANEIYIIIKQSFDKILHKNNDNNTQNKVNNITSTRSSPSTHQRLMILI